VLVNAVAPSMCEWPAGNYCYGSSEAMVFAHIFGIPVEETALSFAPVLVVLVAGLRTYAHNAHRKLRASVRRGVTTTYEPRIGSERCGSSRSDHPSS
jgi:hypothetical protein